MWCQLLASNFLAQERKLVLCCQNAINLLRVDEIVPTKVVVNLLPVSTILPIVFDKKQIPMAFRALEPEEHALECTTQDSILYQGITESGLTLLRMVQPG